MGTERSVRESCSLLGDYELLGRHILNDHPTLLVLPLYLHIVGKDGLSHWDGSSLLGHHHLLGSRWGFPNHDLLLADNFELLVSQHQDKFFFRQVLVGLGVDFFLLVPVNLDCPDLAHQGIFEPVVHDGHAWVVTHKHPVGVLGGLFSLLLVARAIRLKAHHIVGLRKDS